MSWHWDIKEIAHAQDPVRPSAWVYVGIILIIGLIGAIVVIMEWPSGKAAMTREFVQQAFLLPLLISIFSCCMVAYFAVDSPDKANRFWNAMCQQRWLHWSNWTRDHVAVLGSMVLTPEKEIAERMLGLEGAAPNNSGKALALELSGAVGTSRLAIVLEQLLTPFVSAIPQLSQRGDFEIVLQTGLETDLTELRRVMRKFSLPDHLNVSWVAAAAVAPMDMLWSAGPFSGTRLILASQLHDGSDAPTVSELGVALVLMAPDILDRMPTIRPRAYLYRPIMTEADDVEEALPKLLGAEQVPIKRIRHLWFTRLDKRARHAVATAAKHDALSIAAQDLDRALGEPGHANGWAVQALAVQMVWHGQGAQLIASPCAGGMALNIAGPKPTSVREAPPEPSLLSISLLWAAGTSALMLFVFLLDRLAQGRDPYVPWWGYLLYWLALQAVQVIGALVHRRMLSNQFEAIYY